MTYLTLQEELDTLQTIGYTPFFQTDSYTLLFRVEDILQKNKYIYQLRVNYYKATHKAWQLIKNTVFYLYETVTPSRCRP